MKPEPKATFLHADLSGHRQGFAKSKFKNLRGTTQRNWLVHDYLFCEDLEGTEPENSYSNHYWSVSCVKCGTDAILERRQILGKRQRLCAVCKERKLEKARQARRSRSGLSREETTELSKRLSEKAAALFRSGLGIKHIAIALDRSEVTVRAWLRSHGHDLKSAYFEKLKTSKKDDETKKAENAERTREYHARKKREKAEADPDKMICPDTGRLVLTPEARQRRKKESRRKAYLRAKEG